MASPPVSDGERLLVLGEVRTCLIQHGSALTAPAVEKMLRLVPGQSVHAVERPIAHAVSSDRLEQIDCLLSSYRRVKVRGIGTPVTHAVVTGGRILQGSTRICVVPGTAARRLAWGHYLGRPGIVELTKRADPDDLAEGFLTDLGADPALDLGSIAERVIKSVQGCTQLDHRITLRARRTRVLWSAVLEGDTAPTAQISLERDPTIRTVRLSGGVGDLDLALRFCEDLALHDWLLTTVAYILAQADRMIAADQDPLEALQPTVDQLIHLWMPGAVANPLMEKFWAELERHPGFTRQWDSLVARVRDQIARWALRGQVRANRWG